MDVTVGMQLLDDLFREISKARGAEKKFYFLLYSISTDSETKGNGSFSDGTKYLMKTKRDGGTADC